jgi:L-arabinose isomerase
VSEFSNLRVGLLGVGLGAYWSQFSGLEERLRGYLHTVEGRLRGPGRDIINLGLVDSPERALAVGHETRTHRPSARDHERKAHSASPLDALVFLEKNFRGKSFQGTKRRQA